MVALKQPTTLEAQKQTHIHTNPLVADCSTGVEPGKTIIFLIRLFFNLWRQGVKLVQGVNTDTSIFTAHEIAGCKVKQKGRIRENAKHNIEKNNNKQIMRINKQSPVILIRLSDQSIFVPQQF